MNRSSIDHLARSLSLVLSRRGLGGILSLGILGQTVSGEARKHKHKHHHKKKQKAKFNIFGCVDVGNFCKNDDQCCSGVCENGACQAHDANGCPTGQQELICGGTNVVCTSTDGQGGFCNTTTGNAGYCAAKDGVLCLACTKDADCVQLCGDRAACIVCQNADCGGTTICASSVTGGCL